MIHKNFHSTPNENTEFKSTDKEELLIWLMEEYGQQIVRLAFTYVKDKGLAEDECKRD